MVQIIQGTPKTPSTWQTIASGLGQGIGEGIADYSKLTIADKMERLKIHRTQEAEYAQRKSLAQELDKSGLGQFAPIAMAGGKMSDITMLMKEGIDPRELMQGAQQGGQGGYQQNLQGLGGQGYQPNIGPQNIPFGYENQMIPMQNQEAVQDMEGMQSIAGKQPTEPQVQPEKRVEKLELKPLDFYRKKIAPNYDKMGKSAKERVDRQAERDFNSTRGMIDTRMKLEKEPRKYLEETSSRSKSLKEKKTILLPMVDNSGNLTNMTAAKKWLSEVSGAPFSFFATPNEQVMDKISEQLSRGVVKDIGGGRLLATEMVTYMKGNPNLFQSPEAFKKATEITIAQARLGIKEDELANKIANDAIERGETIPQNLRQIVNDLLTPEIDKINKDIDTIIQTKPTSTFKKWTPGQKTARFSGKKIEMIDPNTGTIGYVPIELTNKFVEKGYKKNVSPAK